MLFQYTNTEGESDLRGIISGYFDTTNAGLKGERGSYVKIAATRKEEKGRWLFLSDRVEEVDAAIDAGMQAAVVVREGNAVLSETDRARHALVTSFEDIRIEK